MWSLRVTALAVLLVVSAAAGRHRMRWADIPEELVPKSSVSSSQYPAPRYFEQDLDHYDGTNNATWLQAYYVNDTFWEPGSDAPIFLCVGGEGPPIDGSVVVSSVHCNNAVEWLQEKKALMFAVEHRYYGCHNLSACPIKNLLEKGALKYLSSRQALADLAAFHAFATQAYNLTTNNKWVTFGGSYPGMLAGWARLRYPHLFHASVASSAPVHAILDMASYNDVVAFAYTVSDNDVGGSQECHDNIQDGHATIGNMFTSDSGRQRLASLFGHDADWYSKKDNQIAFAGYGVAMFPAQSNDPSCTQPACNIKSICSIMTDSSIGDNVSRLAHLASTQALWTSLPWQQQEQQRRSAVTTLSSNALPDFWGYQTCTEFGFYQTCEVGSKCFFTQGLVTLDIMMSFCTSEFGIPSSKVARNIDFSNIYYGGVDPAGTCLIYPNGEVDPWSSQSILKSPSSGIQTLFVPGASHHAWTHPSASTDQASVVKARQQIRQAVNTFLGQDCNQATN